MEHNNSQSASYAAAGVDITAGYKAVELMKTHVAPHPQPRLCWTTWAASAACFGPDLAGMERAGAGLRHRRRAAPSSNWPSCMDKHDTVGIDCVAMCVNDIICVRRKAPVLPGLHRLRQERARDASPQIVSGVAEGCVQSGCALIGGETAEHARLLCPRTSTILPASAVGMVDKDEDHRQQTSMAEGDVLIGLASSGVHSNGFSLVRKVFDIDENLPNSDQPMRRAGRQDPAARPC